MMFFVYNDTATTEIYPLSLPDALPIFLGRQTLLRTILQEKLGDSWEDYEWFGSNVALENILTQRPARWLPRQYHDYDAFLADVDRKSTRLNSSHSQISYAVFCLKKNR